MLKAREQLVLPGRYTFSDDNRICDAYYTHLHNFISHGLRFRCGSLGNGFNWSSDRLLVLKFVK